MVSRFGFVLNVFGVKIRLNFCRLWFQEVKLKIMEDYECDVDDFHFGEEICAGHPEKKRDACTGAGFVD